MRRTGEPPRPTIESQPRDVRVGREASQKQVAVQIVAVLGRWWRESQSHKERGKSASPAARARQLQAGWGCISEARIC